MHYTKIILFLLALVLPNTLPAQESNTTLQPNSGFTVATIERKPFAFQNEEGWAGFSIDLWREIANELSIETRFIETESFTELLSAVEDGAAQAAVANISITYEREERMDFSQPIFDSGLMVLSKADGSPGIFSILFNPELLLWLGGAAVLLFLAANLIWFFERRHNSEFNQSYWKGLGDGLWWAFIAVLDAGFDIAAPTTKAGRILAFSLILLGLFVVSAFVAQITASLTVGQLNAQVSGYEDLYDKKVGTTSGSTSANFLIAKSIRHTGYDKIEDVFKALEEGQIDAMVHDAPIVSYYAQTSGRGRFTTVGRLFNPEKYGIALPSGSQRVEEINRALLRIRENGTYQGLIEKWFGDNYQ